MRKNIDIRDEIIADFPEISFCYTDRNCEANLEKKMVLLNRERYNNCNRYFLFVMLHEIGHIKTNYKGESRSQSEHDATVWAIKHSKDYGIYPTEKTLRIFQDDVYKWWKIEKILKRKHPTKKSLTFFK